MISIKRPTLLLDREKCLANINQMATKARDHSLRLEPHFKTHQSAEIGKWFKHEGVNSITVSSVAMAEYFFENGWTDITIAFPVNLREIGIINSLATKCNLKLLVSSPRSLPIFENAISGNVGIYIEIDTGGCRSGILPDETALLENMAERINRNPTIWLTGFLTHAGHTYRAKTREEVINLHNKSLGQMQQIGRYFATLNPLISIGDTPSCCLAGDFTGADIIRPGNFVFFDLMQYELGSCGIEDVAVAVACPVVAENRQRSEVVVYGGAIHLSRDCIFRERQAIYGRAALLHDNGWEILPPGNDVISVSQEHGVIKLEENYYNMVHPGEIIGVIPVHSCLTAHQAAYYQTLNGEIIQKFPFDN